MSIISQPLIDDPPRRASRRPQWHRVRRFQCFTALTLILLITACALALDLAARSDIVAATLSRRLMAQCARDGTLYENFGTYFDSGDRLLLNDLPKADYSQGGVYVLGSSTAMHCLQDYRLPPDQARLFHNYGVYSLNHTQAVHFTRFLIEQQGLLKAGGQNTLVMLGLSYTNLVEPPRGAFYFPAYFTRSGVWNYDHDSGISPAPMTIIERFFRQENARCHSFVRRLWPGPTITPKRVFDPIQFHQDVLDRMGPQWEPAMKRQMAELDRLLDYLRSKQVNVVGFFIPQGSWNKTVIESTRFHREVQQMFAQKGLTLLDYSDLLDDTDFYDSLHPAPRGTAKVQSKLVPIALDFLHTRGLLAASGRERPDPRLRVEPRMSGRVNQHIAEVFEDAGGPLQW